MTARRSPAERTRRWRACGPAVDVTLRLLDGVEEMVHTTHAIDATINYGRTATSKMSCELYTA